MIADKFFDTKGMLPSNRLKKGIDITHADVNQVNLHLHNVLYGLISSMLERGLGKTLIDMEELRIPVVDAPKPTMIALPMFLDIEQA